ncbi:MAG: hypothetical protein BA863_07075 [Desulfovibrio sp. S3730MH75]|nr:MAG: hypothetical protein BA863_07075 [Desulfovibrio sp. S3730MH75]
MIVEVFYSTMLAVGMFDGARRVVRYFIQRNVDERPFSFKRFWGASDGFNPLENLILGITFLSIGGLMLYRNGPYLIQFFLD